jgi:HAD superfamily hydrolase (TIGR01509 family)
VSRLRAVVFDVGETLYSEERAWGAWADWLGVSPRTLGAALGATLALREHHHTAFELLRPGFDFQAEQASRAAAGVPDDPAKLYDLAPGARECLDALRAAGLRVGVAANQPSTVAPLLGELLEPGELTGISEDWGVSKPDPAFYARVSEAVGLPPEEIAYVGDRVDNDVVPAADAGMVAVHLVSGPWAVVQAAWPEAERAAIRVHTLPEVAEALLSGPAGR